MRPRVKTRKSEPDPLSFDGLAARTLPPVLTAAAVAKGLMPALGSSALPPSIEAAIPVPLRYWKAETAERAREIRDELVEASLIEPSEILKVDGVPRVVVWRAFLSVVDEQSTAPLATRKAVEIAGAERLAFTEEPVVAVDAVADPGAWSVERVAETVKNLGSRVLLALSDTPAHRVAIAGLTSAFALETRPGVVYGATVPLDADATHVLPAPPSSVEKAHTVRLVRKDAATPAEERYVFGVVLEPDVVDSQNDTYSADEVRKAAHGFMEKHAQLGQQHAAIVTGKLKILESYIAPVDFAVGEQVIKAGTWLLAIRVVDDELWTAVKAGSFTGFSIGGTAVRQPAAA